MKLFSRIFTSEWTNLDSSLFGPNPTTEREGFWEFSRPHLSLNPCHLTRCPGTKVLIAEWTKPTALLRWECRRKRRTFRANKSEKEMTDRQRQWTKRRKSDLSEPVQSCEPFPPSPKEEQKWREERKRERTWEVHSLSDALTELFGLFFVPLFAIQFLEWREWVRKGRR